MGVVDDYIASFPAGTQKHLMDVRKAILEAAPTAEEGFGYKMPSYKVGGKALVYFAGYAKHVGFYSMGVGQDVFADELSKYKMGRGSIQFPLTEPMPLELIKKIVRLKLKEGGHG